ncbi:MAG TPA: hypothetical protein VLI05_00280 [Candidatus Saccharimonadia bacterium]|nr:hypothetical protein [Candidatus Saccharimonadia bacterium]
MPRKAAQTSLFHHRHLSKLIFGSAILVAILASAGAVIYQWGWMQASAVYADRAYRSAVITDRVAALLRAERAAAHGSSAVTAADLNTLYANYSTPELAAQLRLKGAKAVFCSSRIPVDIVVTPATEPIQGPGSLEVHLSFSETSQAAADNQTVRVTYDWSTAKLIGLVCL